MSKKFKLISGGNKKLITPSVEIDISDKQEIKRAVKIAKSIFKFVESFSTGVGLSAVQVGILKQIFIIHFRGIKKIIINPKILQFGEEKIDSIEGCLSYPGLQKTIKRSRFIEVEYFNGKETINEDLWDTEAIIFQHEYDHLCGKPCLLDVYLNQNKSE